MTAMTGRLCRDLPSQRTGIEIHQRLSPVLLDAYRCQSGAVARPLPRLRRQPGGDLPFLDRLSPAQQYPARSRKSATSAGTFVYNAPWMVASGGHHAWRGHRLVQRAALPLYQFAAADRGWAFVAPPSNIINANVGYRFANGWRIGLDALNLLNSRDRPGHLRLRRRCSRATRCTPHAMRRIPKYRRRYVQTASWTMFSTPTTRWPSGFTLAGPIETINMPAMADELWHAIPAYEPPPADYNWTGFYVGAHGGESRSKNTGSSVNTVTGAASATTFSATASDGFGGLQMGYNYMTPSRVVLGFEADISSGGVKDGHDHRRLRHQRGPDHGVRQRNRALSARLRAGRPVALRHRRLGLVEQSIRPHPADGTVNFATAGMDEAVNKYLFGWTAGAGLAYAFSPQWSAFAEYRHTTYDAAHLAVAVFADFRYDNLKRGRNQLRRELQIRLARLARATASGSIWWRSAAGILQSSPGFSRV